MIARLKENTFFRIIALTVCLTFGWSSLGQADVVESAFKPSSPSNTVDLASMNLPVELGEVSSFHKGSRDQTIVHIVDAHCDYSVQHSIADIIGYCRDNYGIDLVALEGGSGDYDISVFTDISNRKVREATADYFVKHGEVNGAEFYAINNPSRVSLYGIEDAGLYVKNLDTYRNSLKYQDRINKILGGLAATISALKTKIYPPDFAEFDNKTRLFREDKISLEEYFSAISDIVKKENIDISGYPNMVRYRDIIKYKNDIDGENIARDCDALIGLLNMHLPRKYLDEMSLKTAAFSRGRMPPEEYYSYLLDMARLCGIRFEKISNLVKFIDFTRKTKNINKKALDKELKALENGLGASLLKTTEQKKLFAADRKQFILERMFLASLTKDDWEYYTLNRSGFDVASFYPFLSEESSIHHVDIGAYETVSPLDAYRRNMEKFYDISSGRDKVFLDNVTARLKKEKKDRVIIVTGGFHQDNLKKLFADKGYSYIEILPKIEKQDTKCPYFRLISGGADPIITSVINGKRSSLQVATYLDGKLSRMVHDVDAFRQAVGTVQGLTSIGAPVAAAGEAEKKPEDTTGSGREVLYGLTHFLLWQLIFQGVLNCTPSILGNVVVGILIIYLHESAHKKVLNWFGVKNVRIEVRMLQKFSPGIVTVYEADDLVKLPSWKLKRGIVALAGPAMNFILAGLFYLLETFVGGYPVIGPIIHFGVLGNLVMATVGSSMDYLRLFRLESGIKKLESGETYVLPKARAGDVQQPVPATEQDKRLYSYLKGIGIDVKTKAHPAIKGRVVIYEKSMTGFNIIYTNDLPAGLPGCSVYEKDWKSHNPGKPKEMLLRAGLEEGEEAVLINGNLNPGRLKFVKFHESGHAVEGRSEFYNRLADLTIPINIRGTSKEKAQALFSFHYLVSAAIALSAGLFAVLFVSLAFISMKLGYVLSDFIVLLMPSAALMAISRLFYNSWFFIGEGRFKLQPITEIPGSINLSVDHKEYRLLSEDGYFSTVYAAVDSSNVIKLQSAKEIGRLNKERAGGVRPNERRVQGGIAEDMNKGPEQLAARCRWSDLSDEIPLDTKAVRINKSLTRNGALIMEPLISLNYQLKAAVRHGDLDSARALLKEFIQKQRAIWAQGYFDVDATVNNYGTTADGIMVTHDLDYVFKTDAPTEGMYDFFLSRFIRENIRILEEIGGASLAVMFRQLLTEAGIGTPIVGTEERWKEFMRVPVETDSHLVIPRKEEMRASAIKELSALVAKAKEVSVRPPLHEEPIEAAVRDYGLPRDVSPLPALLRTEEIMTKVGESIKGIKFPGDRDTETDRINYYNALRAVLSELAETGWEYEEAKKIAILIIEGLPGKMGYISVPDVSDFGEVNSYSYWLFSGMFVELIRFAGETGLNRDDLYQIIKESFRMNGFDAFIYRKIFEMYGRDYTPQAKKDAIKGIIDHMVTYKDMGSFEVRKAIREMLKYGQESDFAWSFGADVIHEHLAARDREESSLGAFTPQVFDALVKEGSGRFYVQSFDFIDLGDAKVRDFILRNQIGLVPRNSNGVLTLWTTHELLDYARNFSELQSKHRVVISRNGRIYFTKETDSEETARLEIVNTRKGGSNNLVTLEGTGPYVVTEFLLGHCEMLFAPKRVGEHVWGIVLSEVYNKKRQTDELMEMMGLTEDFADANYMTRITVDRTKEQKKGGFVVEVERIDYEPYFRSDSETARTRERSAHAAREDSVRPVFVHMQKPFAPDMAKPSDFLPSFGHTENLAYYTRLLYEAMSAKNYTRAFDIIMEALESVPKEDDIDLSVVNFTPFRNNLAEFVAAVYPNRAGPGYAEFSSLLESSDILDLKERLVRVLPLLRSKQKETSLLISVNARSTARAYMDWLAGEVLFDAKRAGMVKTMDESDMDAVKAISRRVSTRGIRDVELRAAAGRRADDISNNIYVYKDGDKVLGYVYFSYLEKGKSLSINQIAISEENEGKGIASLLLGKALSQAIAQGIVSFECEIKAGAERSFNMFERFGFKRDKANASGFAVRYTLKLTAEAPVSVESSYAGAKKHMEESLQKIKDILASIFRNLFNGEPIRIYVLGATPTGEDGAAYSELEYSSDLVNERVQANRMVNERSGIGTGNISINHTIGMESARKKILDDIANLPSDMPKERIYCAISAFVLNRLEEDRVLTERLGKSVKTFLEERTMLNIIDDFRDDRVYLMPYLETTVLGLTRINLVSELKKTDNINDEGVREAIDMFVRAMALVSNMPDADIKEALRELMAAAKDEPMNFFRNYTFRITLPPITKIRLEELRDHIHSMIEVWRSL